jgi:hypothetical protein
LTNPFDQRRLRGSPAGDGANGEQPMPTLRKKKSFAELAAERKQLYDSFDGREVDDEKIDEPEFRKILAVETKIENATFETDAEKLAGLLILFELNDSPDFADKFKAKLFSRIHQFM